MSLWANMLRELASSGFCLWAYFFLEPDSHFRVRNMTTFRLLYCEQAQTTHMERVCGETNSVMYFEGGREKEKERGGERERPRWQPAFQPLVF